MTDPLELEARKTIYDTIAKHPGIHMRELQRKTALATGSLDYHLHFLQKQGMIRVEKNGHYTRYYTALQSFSSIDKQLIGLLRNDVMRHILVYLLQHDNAPANAIADACSLQPSNLSNYLKTLETNGIITHASKGRYRFYVVVDKQTIVKLMATHQKSFLDALVDNFIDVWTDTR